MMPDCRLFKLSRTTKAEKFPLATVKQHPVLWRLSCEKLMLLVRLVPRNHLYRFGRFSPRRSVLPVLRVSDGIGLSA